jgi:peptidoglycan/LPS O-acetylase OafA/YrhL
VYSPSLTSTPVPTHAEAAPSLGYRPGLDGIRALAVILVAGVHTRPRLIPSGAIGVDVFFVLSGFLITTLLVAELDEVGRISVGRFYARRALRLLPALAGLLVVVTAWALLIASPSTRHRALQEVLAAASYTRNLTWWAHVPGPLLGHTWSLALEEQFYLVWPLVLIVSVRAGRSSTKLSVVFFAAFATLTVLRVAGFAGPGALFIGRPEALLLGAALALARRDHPGRWTGERGAGVAVIVGTVVLLGLAVVDGADDLHGLGYTAAALAAAGTIWGVVMLDESGAARAFAWPPAVVLGRVSYGFYLWHLPVLRWTDDHVHTTAILRVPFGLAMALGATVVSYQFIERPALRLKARFGAGHSQPLLEPI